MAEDKVGPEGLDEALVREERGEVAGALRSAAEGIEPSPEFARQLEARLRASVPATTLPTRSAARGIERASSPLPVASPLPQRPMLPNQRRRTSLGRFTSVVMGVAGLVAVAVMLVGMALLLRARQEGSRDNQTPIAGSPVPSDSLAIARSFVPVRHLPMGRAVTMSWSPDGRTLAAVEWLGPTGSDVSRPLFHEDRVHLKLWDVESATLISSATYSGTYNLNWSPDGSKLAVSVYNQTLHMLDKSGRELYTLRNTISEADLPTGPDAGDVLSQLRFGFGWVRWSLDGSAFIISGEVSTFDPATQSGVIKIRAASDGRVTREIRLGPEPVPTPDTSTYSAPPFYSLFLDWSPDGSKILASSGRGSVRVFDADTGQELYKLDRSWVNQEDGLRPKNVGAPYWSPNSRYLVAIAAPFLEVYDASNGKLVRSLPESLPPPPVPTGGPLPPGTPEVRYDPSEYAWPDVVAWSPDSKALASSSLMKLRVWDPVTGELIRSETTGGSNNIAWSPDGKVFAYLDGMPDEGRVNVGTLVLQDASTWQRLGILKEADTEFGSYNDFAWSPDGGKIAVSDKKGIVLWSTPTGETIPTLPPSPSPAHTALTVPTAPATRVQVPTIVTPNPPDTPQPVRTPCGAWSIVEAPRVDMVNELLAVDALALDDVWAVGYHSDGQPQYVIATPVPGSENAPITPVPGSERPLIMHWDGQSWKSAAVPEIGEGNARLTGVAAIAPGDVWVVGYHGGKEEDETRADKSRTLILHYDGKEWRRVTSPNEEGVNNRLYALAALSSDNVWAVGHSGGGYDLYSPDAPIWKTLILHWDGVRWVRVESTNPAQYGNRLYGLSAAAPDDIWAVGLFVPRIGGGGGGMNPHAFSLHWDGKEWRHAPVPEDANFLAGVLALSRNNAWAVGSLVTEGSSDSKALSWDGTAWNNIPVTVHDTPQFTSPYHDQLRGIASSPQGEIWAVGSFIPWDRLQGHLYDHVDTLVIYWDGTRWVQIQSPNAPAPGQQNPSQILNQLNAVSALPTGEVWAVGSVTGDSSMSAPLVLRYIPSGCATPTPGKVP